MKFCTECDCFFPNYDSEGQPMDRCPQCGIPFDNEEVVKQAPVDTALPDKDPTDAID